MPKSPFEKVRSLVERKKLFESLLQEQSEILCKGNDDSLFQFKPISIISDTLMQGYMTSVEKLPENDVEVIGNFAVSSEKFFFKANFKIMQEEAIFHLNCNVFKLQRRSSIRLHVPPSLGIYLALTEFQNKTIYSIAQIADISAGGARIFFSELDSPIPASINAKAPNLRVGDRFKGILHTGDKRSMDLICEVRHIQQGVHRGQIVDQIGLEFVDLTGISKNRLLSMTMDLQSRMVNED